MPKNILSEHNDEHTSKQIFKLIKTILHQNYFTFQNNTYQPEKGVSMGFPISNIVAEIFIQHFENTHLKHILEAKTILFYTRYVDNILMIYNTKHTTPEKIHNLINKIHPNLQFAPTHVYNNTMHFLDLFLIRHTDKIEIGIFRKPTTTDTTINYTSNHPTEHKMAAYHFLIHRMSSLPLTTERKKTKWQTILSIAKNNNFLHTSSRK
jgi:hypothetical protein